MSLSPLVSFKSRFVTYLLNFPRITEILGRNGENIIWRLYRKSCWGQNFIWKGSKV